MKKHILAGFCCLFSLFLSAQSEPYRNKDLSVDERIEDLLSRMTLDEKISQIRHLHNWDILDGKTLNPVKLRVMCGTDGFGFFEGFPLPADSCRVIFREIQQYMVDSTRLGIPAFPVAESLHGIVHEGATVFPQNVALGATFDPSLAYDRAKATAGELNTIGIRQVLAPCIDVARDLRWGRVEESYGEDLFLCSEMAVAEALGYIDNGISPMLKHYGPHGNPLGGLNLASVECGVRDLFDIYLKPFEKTIEKAPVMAVMSSYNSWNRTPNSASSFMLSDILRDRFGFKGYVYSDWGVISMLRSFHHTAEDDYEAAVQAITAGLDVEASSNCYPLLKDAVDAGEFDVEYIDRAVRRVLRAKFETGLFDDPYGENVTYRLPVRCSENVALSRRIADESAVLLKNEGKLLPLDASKLKSVAVIGPNADEVQFGDYTWSKDKNDGVTPLQGIRALLGRKVKVNYARGCSLASADTAGFAEAVDAARRSDVAIVFLGSSSTAFVRHSPRPSTSGEGIDLHDIALTGAQQQLIERIVSTGKLVVVVMVAGKPFAVKWIKDNVPAVLAQWYAGEQAGNSIADILFGRVNPSGRISFSFPQSTGHLPAYYNHLSTDRGFYHQPGTPEQPGRDYVFSSPDALWAFGHGLSYTDFEYIDARADKAVYAAGDTVFVDVAVRNSGRRPGKEVVQLYVRDVVSSVMTPVKQLKAFDKIYIEPQKTVTVRLAVPVTELMLTDDFGKRFLEEGEFEFMVGSASDNIAFTVPVQVGEPKVRRQSVARTEETVVSDEILTVSGCVRDVQATPVAGVAVSQQGSGSFAYTDADGNYTISVRGNVPLQFSKDGYRSVSVIPAGQTTINVSMSH